MEESSKGTGDVSHGIHLNDHSTSLGIRLRKSSSVGMEHHSLQPFLEISSEVQPRMADKTLCWLLRLPWDEG